jgi:hypothetical protein
MPDASQIQIPVRKSRSLGIMKPARKQVPMSASGQKLPRRGQSGMSALLPKAAAAVGGRRGSFGPKADILLQQRLALFDHLVGGSEQRLRECQAQRLSRLEV